MMLDILFVLGNTCNINLIQDLFKKYNFSDIIYFSVESNVDNSIKSLDSFLRINFFVTFNRLDVSKNYRMTPANSSKKEFENAEFHCTSTDEV
jgi:dTDP-glucose 4,6-dehydratase